MEDIQTVGRIALRDCWPDLVVVFDVDAKTAAARLNPLLDRIERRGAEYHRRVREGYLDQVKRDPKGYAVVDATVGADEVFERLVEVLGGRI